MKISWCSLFFIALAGLPLAGCNNSPYPAGLTKEAVYFASQTDDPRKLDPASSYRANEGQILDVICASYYEYQPLKTKKQQLQLMLGDREATREPYIYTDSKQRKTIKGERWSFHIRSDLKFQDDPCFPGGKGRPITAQDFLYAFRRMADPTVGSPVQNFFSDKVLGFADLIASNAQRQKDKQPADYTSPIPGVQLDPKDPYAFTILLNQPFPQLRYLMAMHFTAPMPHEAVEYYKDEINHHPVGCGPFMLQEWTPKQRLILAKNPNRPSEFYPSEGEPGDKEAGLLDSAGKQLPLVDKVVITTIPEGITGWNLFLQGYMDSWSVTQTNFSQVMTQQGSLSDDMKQRGIRLVKSNDLGLTYFAFNMRDPVVGGYTPQKRKLRQAISLSLNSQEFIELFDQGNGLRSQSVIPPGIYGYEASYRNPYRTYDPKLARAKELLKEAGYPNGIDPKSGQRLTIYYDNARTDAGGRQFNSLVTRQIEALGINLESRPQRDVVWQNKIEGNDWQLTDYGWLADYPDAENFLGLLYAPNLRPGPNLTGYANPAYDKLFEQVRAMDDSPTRLKLMNQMRTMIQEDCPLVYLENRQKLSLYYGWVGPNKPHPIANTLFKLRKIDGPMRAKLQQEWNKPVFWPLGAFALVLVLGTLPAVQVVKNRHRRRVTQRLASTASTAPQEAML